MQNEQKIIAATKRWVERFIIRFNICPFAGKVFTQEQIHYVVVSDQSMEKGLLAFHHACQQLDANLETDTTLLIYPDQFADFAAYLDFVDLAQSLLIDFDYEGIYQIASFHPDYQFAGSAIDDPANYTNRSLYPMLHLLRESSVEKAIEFHDDPEAIPAQNIAFAQAEGLEKMKQWREDCWKE